MDSSLIDSKTSEVVQLNQRIIACSRCPRLRTYCEDIGKTKRKAFQTEDYWTKPVPNFGDATATRLIVGLAPAAHGANRTGRMFTGDRSGDFLFSALYKLGIASQAHATSRNDGLDLKGVLITASVHCAPPDNKPTPTEIGNCSEYLRELLMGRTWRSVLCLGQLAWNQVFRIYKGEGRVQTIPKFGHGAQIQLDPSTTIHATFHPSQQNTFTGRLTEEMFLKVLSEFLTDSQGPTELM